MLLATVAKPAPQAGPEGANTGPSATNQVTRRLPT